MNSIPPKRYLKKLKKVMMTKHKSVIRGIDLLHDPSLNKGTAFTATERDILGLHGLLPPREARMIESAPDFEKLRAFGAEICS